MKDNKPAVAAVKKFKTVILVPVLNEEAALDSFINLLSELKEDVGVLFIVTEEKAANSPDASLEKIENFSKSRDGIFFITNARRGLGLAYRQGFEYALCNFSFEYLCTMDADGSHDVFSVSDLLKNGRQADVVIASRYIHGGAVEKWNFLRLFGSRLIGRTVSFLLPWRIFDPTSGFRLYSRQLLERLDFSRFKSEGFVFQLEILFKSLCAGGIFFEAPICFKGREQGKSKLRIFDVFEYLYVAGIDFWWFLARKIKLAGKIIFWHVKLLKQVLAAGFSSAKIFRLMISVSNVCNFNCFFCGLWRQTQKKTLDIKTAEKIFSKWGKDLFFLTLTGGEPFLDKDYLISIIEVAKRSSPNLYYLSLNTNGYFSESIFSVINFLLQKYPFLKIYVGVNYWLGPEQGSKITGREDAFYKMEETIEGLRHLKKIFGRRLSYYGILTVNSKGEIEQLTELGDDIWLNFAERSVFYNNTDRKDLGVMNLEEKSFIINDFYRKNKHSLGFLNKMFIHFMKRNIKRQKRLVGCYAGQNRLYFNQEGEQYICSRGLKNKTDKTNEACDQCWTSCEAVFDIIEYLLLGKK